MLDRPSMCERREAERRRMGGFVLGAIDAMLGVRPRVRPRKPSQLSRVRYLTACDGCDKHSDLHSGSRLHHQNPSSGGDHVVARCKQPDYC